jgi:uncharacterized protein (TIGR00251 family)
MFREKPGAIVEIEIWAQPGASKTKVAGQHGERLKVQIAAPPVEGAANEELLRFLKKRLKAQVELVQGAQSRSKTVRITGLTLAEVRAKLEGEK